MSFGDNKLMMANISRVIEVEIRQDDHLNNGDIWFYLSSLKLHVTPKRGYI